MWEWRNKSIGIKRPLFIIGISVLIGGGLFLLTDLTVSLCYLGAVLVLAAVFLFARNKSLALTLLLSFISALASIICVAALHKNIYEKLWELDIYECELTGKIVDIPEHDGDKTKYILEISEMDGAKLNYRFKVRFTTDILHDGDIYDTVKAQARFYKPENISGTNFNSESYYLADEIPLTAVDVGTLEPYLDSSSTLIPNDGDYDLNYYILKLRQSLINILSDGVSDEASGILRGILLGDKSGISEKANDNFIYSGVSHLFCVSGLHLTFILSVFFFISRKFYLHRRLVCSAGIIFILIFMALTGFPKSVIRAGIMCIVTLIAEIFFSEADALNSLGLSVIVVFFINPMAMADVGFLLSVFSTLGLLTLFRPVYLFSVKLFRIKKNYELKSLPVVIRVINLIGDKILMAVSVYIAVTAATMPVLFLTFKYVSLISALSNLVIVPLGEFMLILGLLFIPLKLILPIKVFSITVVFAVEKLADLILSISESLASIKFTVFPISAKTLIYFAVAFAAGVILFNFIKTYKSRSIIAVSLSVLFITSVTLAHINEINRLKIYMWGTDAASCVVLTKSGKSLILSYNSSFANYPVTAVIIRDTAFDLQGVMNICEEDMENISRITDRYMTVNNVRDEFIFDGDVYISRKATDKGSFIELNYKGFSALFTFNADSSLSQSVTEEYDLVYADIDRYSVTDYIVDNKIANILVYNDRYDDNGHFKEKCISLGYEIYSTDDCASSLVTADKNGNCKVEEWK